MKTSAEIKLDISQLPVERQVALLYELWEELGTTAEAALLTEAQKTELLRRREEYEEDPNILVPWSEVRDGLKARRGRR